MREALEANLDLLKLLNSTGHATGRKVTLLGEKIWNARSETLETIVNLLKLLNNSTCGLRHDINKLAQNSR